MNSRNILHGLSLCACFNQKHASVLMNAAAGGDQAVVEMLLNEYKMDPNQRDFVRSHYESSIAAVEW